MLDQNGRPATDEALYMGMLGHAAFIKTDGTVFAHIHPNGTMSMAAFMMANPQMPMHGEAFNLLERNAQYAGHGDGAGQPSRDCHLSLRVSLMLVAIASLCR